jgi:hypothetical protein
VSAETTFDATQDTLESLLREVGQGKIQLPDFQRGWVWDDEHICSVITSVSRSFPIGAVMTLVTGGEVTFKPRPVEGVEFAGARPAPERLVLDGQQRLTSLYQALNLRRAIRTRDDRQRETDRWYYVDMLKALGTPEEREQAVFSVPTDKQVKRDFGRVILLDLSSPEKEYAAQTFPLNLTFTYDDWFEGFRDHWEADKVVRKRLDRFRQEFIDVFKSYSLPVIQLRKNASKEAVCRVFEKVNSGGVALTAFELATATYAADGYNLREDWFGSGTGKQRLKGRAERLAEAGPVLRAVENTDFLQAVALLCTAARRAEARDAAASGRDLPAISCTRQTILTLPLEGYRAHADRAEEGFRRARQFLWREKVFGSYDLPYRTQSVPLATTLVSLGERWKDDAVRRKVRQWYWCGVFGELYGSAIESRFARDLPEVVAWALEDGSTPQTVLDCNLSAERLRTLRSRLSAAYKGLHALVMQRGGARDWRTGAGVDEQTYFDEAIDIHHIFPRAWCDKRGIDPGIYNSIVNKTALSSGTNRSLQGDAPSVYFRRLQQQQHMPPERVDSYVATHFIEPGLLRADDFAGMMEDRARRLAEVIEEATGRQVSGKESPWLNEGNGSARTSEQEDVLE